LRVYRQAEVGKTAYDKGAKQLEDFFHDELKKFLKPELLPLGKQIIECCLNGGSVEDYASLIPMTY